MSDASPKIRVLLANDRAIVRSGIRRALERSGQIEVLAEAHDGEEALSMIRELTPDVAVIDLLMQQVCGSEVVREVQFNCWPVGILVFTSCDEDPTVIAILQSGANGAALVTASPDDMIDAVRQAYDGKMALNSSALPRIMAQVARLDICPEIMPLTEKEVEIMAMLARGMTNQEIGCRLELSNYTVQWHLIQIFDKLQVGNRTEAVMRALAMGVLQGTQPGTPDYVVFQN
jgi:NarL family two-component system response regulator LiaR